MEQKLGPAVLSENQKLEELKRSINEQKGLVRFGKDEIASLQRRVDAMEKNIYDNETKYWKLQKEKDPTLSECEGCSNREGFLVCSYCGGKFCCGCVRDDEDSFYHISYTCERCQEGHHRAFLYCK